MTAERATIQYQHRKTLGGRINRGGEASRASADDNHIIDLLLIDRSDEAKATGKLVVAGIAEQFTTGAQNVDSGRFLLTLANKEHIRARSVVIATGAQYRRFDIDNLAPFEGLSVHYWASPLEARLCAGQEVALVGAGNSAGQAVVYLSSQVAKL